MECKPVSNILLDDSCFWILDKCPWDACESEDSEWLYKDIYGSDVVKCHKCGCVYAKRRLNQHGLEVYWENYSSRCHTADESLNEQRTGMYQLDFSYIDQFMDKNESPHVLDVGCGEGNFLDIFEKAGYVTAGIEYGHEAAEIAAKKHKVWEGDLSTLDLDATFDLIIFRGVLQYLPDVKANLKKAVEVLNYGGYIYITAQPNMDSLCAKLFKDKFALGVSSSDFIGLNEGMITEYFSALGGVKQVSSKYFYEETPYADVENDIMRVAKAIELNKNGKDINFSAPAFWGNMMSLVYRKTCIFK